MEGWLSGRKRRSRKPLWSLISTGGSNPPPSEKLMDIIQIKKLINDWQSSFSTTDNYKIIKIIKEIINVYQKLDDKQKEMFYQNIKPILNKIFNNIYSNDSLLRREVVNLAYTLEINELIPDVFKYIKIENDYENILVYLKYIDKFSAVGFVDNLFEFIKQENLPISIKIKAFSVIANMITNYKNNSMIIDYIFNYLFSVEKNYQFIRLLADFFRDLVIIILRYYNETEKSKIISFFTAFCEDLFIKTKEFIIKFTPLVNDEIKTQAVANSFILNFVILLVLDKLEYFDQKNKDNDTSKILKEDLDIVLEFLIQNIQSRYYLFLFLINLIQEYNLVNEFCNYLEEKTNIVDQIVSIFLTDPEKTKKVIIKFILVLNLKLSEKNLKEISQFCRNTLNEDILNACLDIFEKNMYYEDILYFMKYSSNFREETRKKIKKLLKNMIKSKTE